MHQNATFEERLTDFLHIQFPDSLEIPADELNQILHKWLTKAHRYGLESEEHQAVYVTTAYMLGEDFDTDFPAVADVLPNPYYSADEKARWLENWTKLLFETLEQGAETSGVATSGVATSEAGGAANESASEPSVSEYLSMETHAQPFRELADEVVEQLMKGNANGFLEHFSPNFRQQLGLPTVERVLDIQILPFFAGCSGVGNSLTITQTHDAFGSHGFAFYRTVIAEEGERPFVLYVVNEEGRLVVANLVVNKTYEDMH